MFALKNLVRLDFGCPVASVYNITDINSSFAKGSVRIMYTGNNRNGSNIERAVVEAALPSLINVPIVCNYDLDTNTIGSHDIDVVAADDGGLRIRNLTNPIGVVPESASFRFENITDGSGNEHEYLIADDVILWKRQEAYRHIVDDLSGSIAQSMEVNVLDGRQNKETDVYEIKEMEFTALCLLESAQPCFENAGLELFSLDSFKQQMSEMMAELKESLSQITAGEDPVDDITDYSTEGGNVLKEKLAILAEYNLTEADIDFSLEDYTVEELREKFAAEAAPDVVVVAEEPAEQGDSAVEEAEAEPVSEVPAEEEESVDPEHEAHDPEPEPVAEVPGMRYELNGNIRDEIRKAVHSVQIRRPWGEESRYWLQDFDAEAMMVYAEDCMDGNLYGFEYHMDGDRVVVDFECGKRKKWAIVDYVEGVEEMPSPLAPMMYMLEAVGAKFEEMDSMSSELEELRQFKADIDEANIKAEREKVFAEFADLEGIEAFETLKSECGDMSRDALEEKCFAIRGRLGTAAKFSVNQRSPRIKVEYGNFAENEPYGGLMAKYGIRAE